MTPADRAQLEADLERDEGVESRPYQDTVGKWTIGVGRNLSDKGLSADEIRYLLSNDVDEVLDDLDRALPWWRRMTPNRQRALANLCFNLGLPRLLTFRKALFHMEQGRYADAAAELRASRWARQVGARAERVTRLVEQG